VDNYSKAVLDSLNKALWEDDSQIQALYVTKDWANPGEDGYFTVSIEVIKK
jgi:Holliday junction resolvase RusA-like endonuclease